MAQIVGLYRFPIRGLAPQALTETELMCGQALPFDRAWQLAVAAGDDRHNQPSQISKTETARLMRDAALACLGSSYDAIGDRLYLTAKGGPIASAPAGTAEGRDSLGAALAGHLQAGLQGWVKVAPASSIPPAGTAAGFIHIVNLQSIRELEHATGRTIDPLRFRPNIVIDGIAAWSEFDWIGQSIAAGSDAILRPFERTARCAITSVDPQTGQRDFNIPAFLRKTYGHVDFGVYAEIEQSGTISVANDLQKI